MIDTLLILSLEGSSIIQFVDRYSPDVSCNASKGRLCGYQAIRLSRKNNEAIYQDFVVHCAHSLCSCSSDINPCSTNTARHHAGRLLFVRVYQRSEYLAGWKARRLCCDEN